MEQFKRVALYARVSTTDQTPQNQLLDLRAYCSRRGWTALREFVDAGISGAKEDRPALRELMEAVRKRQVDIVLVWRFDRFARSTSHLVAALQEFRDRDIDFASYSENIDTATAQGKMVFTIFAAVAEFERALIVERIKSGLRRAVASGKRVGRAPLSEQQVADIMALQGTCSSRAAGTRLGLSKTIVNRLWNGQRKLATKPIENVAMAIDGDRVAN